MNHVLIIGSIWPEPSSSAAGSRMMQLITLFLTQEWKITFASTAQKGIRKVDLSTLKIDEVAIELNNSSFDIFIQKLNPTIVLFDRFMMEEQFGWRVTESCPTALKILDTEDLHCLRKTRYEAIKNNKKFETEDLLDAEITKREIASIYRCDLSLIISTYEIELLKGLFKIDESLLYYLPFLLDKIKEEQIKNLKSFEERQHFISIGNFLHAPNIDAAFYLKKTIWPLIRKQLPNAEIHIYGAYITQQILELHNAKEGFLIKGFATNAQKVVSNAKVCLAPLRFGAGIKGKLTEAMQNGTPSITTTIGAEGMHAELPWNGSIEDSPEKFADKAVELYVNKSVWEKFQKNGIQIINQLYSKEKLSKPFLERLKNLQTTIEKHRTHNFIGAMLQHHTLQSTKYLSKWIEAKNS